MATMVLVPGATLGAWCWKWVTPLLRNLGHEVYPLTLTGLAERAHLLSATINLETHIQDIVSMIEVEDLTDVILVGHSLGVDPVTGAADRIPERIAQIVYFDSIPSKNGDSGLVSSSEDWQAWVLSRVVETGRGPIFQSPDMRNFGLSDEADIEWANSKATPHPFHAWSNVIHLYNEDALARISKSYIACIGDSPRGGPHQSGTEEMDYYELPFGHMAMINAPQEVTRLFDTIAIHSVIREAQSGSQFEKRGRLPANSG